MLTISQAIEGRDSVFAVLALSLMSIRRNAVSLSSTHTVLSFSSTIYHESRADSGFIAYDPGFPCYDRTCYLTRSVSYLSSRYSRCNVSPHTVFIQEVLMYMCRTSVLHSIGRDAAFGGLDSSSDKGRSGKEILNNRCGDVCGDTNFIIIQVGRGREPPRRVEACGDNERPRGETPLTLILRGGWAISDTDPIRPVGVAMKAGGVGTRKTRGRGSR